MITRVKTQQEIVSMRESGRMLASVLKLLAASVSLGMSTKDLAEIAKTELKKLGGQPTFLGYYGFPDVLCVSLNDEVVHGIPRKTRIVQEGDIVSMDFGVTYQGMVTDAATSVIVGKTTESTKQLVDVTKRSLDSAIAVVRDGVYTGDIGYAVQKVLESKDYGIVRDLVGHGVGHELHEDPNIPNYGKKQTGHQLSTGMTIAIEPMATLGGYHVQTDADNWTIRTRDGSLAAHFEHTVLVTDKGSEILTVC